LAAGDLGLSFDGTAYAFLESPAFLAAVGVALAALIALELRGGAERLNAGLAESALTVAALATGALLFAGSLADRGHASWPGLLGGAACAAVAIVGTRGVLRRASSRLGDASPTGLYADVASAAAVALVVLGPPLAVLLLGYLARLAYGERRRGGERYAGLRILR
jgi:hypothetical protein